MASSTLKSDKGVPVRVTEVDKPLQVNKNFVDEDLRSSGIILEFNKDRFSWRPGRHCDEQGLKRTEQRETHRRYMGCWTGEVKNCKWTLPLTRQCFKA